MASEALIEGVSAVGRGLALAAPVVVGVVMEAPVVRMGLRPRRAHPRRGFGRASRKGRALRVSVGMNVASALALVWAAPWVGEAWRAIPGLLENPIHRWWARGKLSPYEMGFVVGAVAAVSVLVELGVLRAFGRVRRVGRVVLALVVTNALSALAGIWWVGVIGAGA